jgi:hypothetical protein
MLKSSSTGSGLVFKKGKEKEKEKERAARCT